MSAYSKDLAIAPILERVVEEVSEGTGITPLLFWESFGEVVSTFGPEQAKLLGIRDEIQKKLDAFHKSNPGQFDAKKYISYLREIEYLVEESEEQPVQVQTKNVDDEVASIAGPQLVVPADNARYALNAANARWGNLFDALYGSNLIDDTYGAAKGAEGYNPVRGQRVFDFSNAILDDIVPIVGGKYKDVVNFGLKLSQNAHVKHELHVSLSSGVTTKLCDPSLLCAVKYDELAVDKDSGVVDLEGILFCHHGLHVEIVIDRNDPIGKAHKAGVKAFLLESAVSTIIDMEDSVAAVDAEDKARVYRNFAGLMRGNLSTMVREKKRVLKPDKVFKSLHPNGPQEVVIPGRALLLVRNCGMHMYTDAVKYKSSPVPEGILDLWFTVLSSLHDLSKGTDEVRNSRRGSVYVVKPKMHGPSEVDFTLRLFHEAEKAFSLPQFTLKIGIMDEERRTSVNLRECIRLASHRLAFTNTGFLDRTGDEIHTSMHAGPMMPTSKISSATWRVAYENWNVDVGLACGMKGIAQIGKGMWAEPDNMNGLFQSKISHPMAGANVAWVPSPTGATIHALHYHQANVFNIQERIFSCRRRSEQNLLSILTPPLALNPIAKDEVREVLDTSTQAILGYVVRWIEHGVGCSKVPDLHNIGKMEDRATLRISSQLLANWLLHGVLSKDELYCAFVRWATIVDKQNANDPQYRPMSSDLDKSIPFQTALKLVFEGASSPNGYTETILHSSRRREKERFSAH
jgi:malate synthase